MACSYALACSEFSRARNAMSGIGQPLHFLQHGVSRSLHFSTSNSTTFNGTFKRSHPSQSVRFNVLFKQGFVMPANFITGFRGGEKILFHMPL